MVTTYNKETHKRKTVLLDIIRGVKEKMEEQGLTPYHTNKGVLQQHIKPILKAYGFTLEAITRSGFIFRTAQGENYCLYFEYGRWYIQPVQHKAEVTEVKDMKDDITALLQMAISRGILNPKKMNFKVVESLLNAVTESYSEVEKSDDDRNITSNTPLGVRLEIQFEEDGFFNVKETNGDNNLYDWAKDCATALNVLEKCTRDKGIDLLSLPDKKITDLIEDILIAQGFTLLGGNLETGYSIRHESGETCQLICTDGR